MAIAGVLLLIVGGLASGLVFIGKAPEILTQPPLGFAVWIGIAVAGAVLILLNRRPGN